jgi:hypothetical protein
MLGTWRRSRLGNGKSKSHLKQSHANLTSGNHTGRRAMQREVVLGYGRGSSPRRQTCSPSETFIRRARCTPADNPQLE